MHRENIENGIGLIACRARAIHKDAQNGRAVEVQTGELLKDIVRIQRDFGLYKPTSPSVSFSVTFAREDMRPKAWSGVDTFFLIAVAIVIGAAIIAL